MTTDSQWQAGDLVRVKSQYTHARILEDNGKRAARWKDFYQGQLGIWISEAFYSIIDQYSVVLIDDTLCHILKGDLEKVTEQG